MYVSVLNNRGEDRGNYGVEVDEMCSFQATAQSDWRVERALEDHSLREEDQRGFFQQ